MGEREDLNLNQEVKQIIKGTAFTLESLVHLRGPDMTEFERDIVIETIEILRRLTR